MSNAIVWSLNIKVCVWNQSKEIVELGNLILGLYCAWLCQSHLLQSWSTSASTSSIRRKPRRVRRILIPFDLSHTEFCYSSKQVCNLLLLSFFLCIIFFFIHSIQSNVRKLIPLSLSPFLLPIISIFYMCVCVSAYIIFFFSFSFSFS